MSDLTPICLKKNCQKEIPTQRQSNLGHVYNQNIFRYVQLCSVGNFCTDDTRSLQLGGNPLQTTNNMCLFVKWEEIAVKIRQNEEQMKAKTILFSNPFPTTKTPRAPTTASPNCIASFQQHLHLAYFRNPVACVFGRDCCER